MNKFSDILLNWYANHARELPWRGLSDPYRIWVSEIVLQQTRVEQGWGHYVRFVERFPTVQALAMASEDEVMKQWQGLGYYARARNLHAAAKLIGEGEFPTTYEGVRALPGVGTYTAAAVCSIAYGLPYAVVDGNVYRVLARYFAIDEAIDTPQGQRVFAQMAAELLPVEAGRYNQAVMDFGALQCVPQSPLCGNCPLQETCAAYRTGRVGELPVKMRKGLVQDLFLHYIYVCVGEDVCLRKREPNRRVGGFEGSAIWKGLYEPPLVVTPTAVGAEEFLHSQDFRALFACYEEYRLAESRVVREDVVHRLSHRALHLNFYAVRLPRDVRSFAEYVHVLQGECRSYPVPRPIEDLFDLVLL